MNKGTENEQGLLERQITILRDRLDRAQIIDESAAKASGVVGVGSHVAIEMDDVPIRLRPALPSRYPSDEEVLRAIAERVREPAGPSPDSC